MNEQGDMAWVERASRQAEELFGAKGAFRLGFLLEERGDVAGAEVAYRRAVERGSADAANNLGALLERRGDMAEAITFHRFATDRGNQDSRRALARVEAQARTRQVPPPSPDTVSSAQAMYLLGEYHARHGDLEQAKGAWFSCLGTGDPAWVPYAGVALGELLRQHGEPPAAEHVLRQVIDSSSGEPAAQARLALGVLLADRGDVENALAAYQAVIESGQPEQVPYAWFDIGELRHQAGDLETASEAYVKAIASRHPQAAPRAAVNLGVARSELQDWTGAVNAFELAIRSSHPEQAPMAARNLAAIRAQQGDQDEAARLAGIVDAFEAAPPRTDLQLAEDHHAAAKELRRQSVQAERDGQPVEEVLQLVRTALAHASDAFYAFERAAGTGATVPEIMEELCLCTARLDETTQAHPDPEALRAVARRLHGLAETGDLSPEGRELLDRLTPQP
jgi:tetratricopeptide (TPR) repeat protein